MKKSSKIILTVLLVAASSSAVYAFGGRGHMNMSPAEKAEYLTEKVTKKLALDNQQKQNLSELTSQFVEIMTDARASKQAHMQEIQQILSEPSLDQNRLLQLVQEKTQLVNDRAPGVIASLGKFLDSLNLEQKQELRSMIQHRHKHHRNGHGHGEDN